MDLLQLVELKKYFIRKLLWINNGKLKYAPKFWHGNNFGNIFDSIYKIMKNNVFWMNQLDLVYESTQRV